jgi:hypothetical protein
MGNKNVSIATVGTGMGGLAAAAAFDMIGTRGQALEEIAP